MPKICRFDRFICPCPTLICNKHCLSRNPTFSGHSAYTKASSSEWLMWILEGRAFFLQRSIPVTPFGTESRCFSSDWLRVYRALLMWHLPLFRINDESWFKDKYEVDDVHFQNTNAISKYLQQLSVKKVLLLVSRTNIVWSSLFGRLKGATTTCRRFHKNGSKN